MSYLFFGVLIPWEFYFTAIVRYYLAKKKPSLSTNLTSKETFQLYLREVDNYLIEDEDDEICKEKYFKEPLSVILDDNLDDLKFGELNQHVIYLKTSVMISIKIDSPKTHVLDPEELVDKSFKNKLEAHLKEFYLNFFCPRILVSGSEFPDGMTETDQQATRLNRASRHTILLE